MNKFKCEDCHDTGWTGDNGPGIKGNREYHPCDCKQQPAVYSPHEIILETGIKYIRADLCR